MIIRTIGDRIAISLMPGLGKIGRLFIPDATKSTRNQTFCRAKVVAHGSKVQGAKEGKIIVVSEYFGDEVVIEGKTFRIGRERDIVGVLRKGDINPQPVGDRVLIEKIDPPKMFGILHLPEDMSAQQFKARVLAVGPEGTVKIGNTVMVPKAVSVEVRFDGSLFYLVDEPAILGVL